MIGEPTFEQIAIWFTSSSGRVIAGAMVWAAIYAIRFFPGIRDKYLTERWQQRLLTILLAIAPAIALALTTEVSTNQLLLTSLTAFLEATGLHHVAKSAMPALGGPSAPEPGTVVLRTEKVIDPVLANAIDNATKRSRSKRPPPLQPLLKEEAIEEEGVAEALEPLPEPVLKNGIK